ncbi:MAG: patatin-like phospholipase family protein [Kiritimatiellia bacterium]|nr:patatin-like phospholipase family protein [Kiritimatiellia bacterium]
MRKRKPVLGLVLGSGGARGWAHLGVLRQLKAQGIHPDLVVGTSIGALVGATYAARHTETLEQVARGLDWKRMLHYFVEWNLPRAGLLDGIRIERWMHEILGRQSISSLPLPFCAVATDLERGAEIPLREGDLIQAVRASFSIPGIFTPVQRDGRTLVDGGLVNPLPVSVARDMGADRVIAVEINLRQPTAVPRTRRPAPEVSGRKNRLLREIQARLSRPRGPDDSARPPGRKNPALPGIFEVLTQSLRILEHQVTLRRLELEPPDVLIQPAVGHIRTLDFQTAPEGIAAGEAAAREQIDAIRRCLS